MSCKTKVYQDLYQSASRDEFWKRFNAAALVAINWFREKNNLLDDPLEPNDLMIHTVKGVAYPDYLYKRVKSRSIIHSGALAIALKTTSRQLYNHRAQKQYNKDRAQEALEHLYTTTSNRVNWEVLDSLIDGLAEWEKKVATTYLSLTVRHKENDSRNTTTPTTARKRCYHYYKSRPVEEIDKAIDKFILVCKDNWASIIINKE